MEAVNGFADAFRRHWADGMAAKLGLPAPDPELADDLAGLMRAQHVDFTQFFRALSAGTARSLFIDPAPFDAWAARRDALLPADRAAVAAAMDRVNPVYIPRNHRVEEALTAATKGDLGPFRTLLDAVSAPYTPRPGLEDHTGPAPEGGARVRHLLRHLNEPRGHRLTLRAARPPPREPVRRIGRGSHGRGDYAPEAVAATPDRSGYPSAGSGPPARAWSQASRRLRRLGATGGAR